MEALFRHKFRRILGEHGERVSFHLIPPIFASTLHPSRRLDDSGRRVHREQHARGADVGFASGRLYCVLFDTEEYSVD